MSLAKLPITDLDVPVRTGTEEVAGQAGGDLVKVTAKTKELVLAANTPTLALNGRQFRQNGTVGTLVAGVVVQVPYLELDSDFLASLTAKPSPYTPLLAAATTGSFAELPRGVWGTDGQAVWNLAAPANSEVDYLLYVPTPPQVLAVVMGFGLSNANSEYSTYDYSFFNNGGNYSAPGTSQIGYDPEVYAGDWMRLNRNKTTGVVTMLASRDGLRSWDALYTHPTPTTAALYLKAHIVSSGKSVYAPQALITT